MERDPEAMNLERPSDTKAAMISTKAAIITCGKYPRTSFCRNRDTPFWSPPGKTKLSEGSRKTIITNHLTTWPIKYPEFRFIPAFLKKPSAPIDLSRLSIFRLPNTCSTAFAIKEPKNQPTTKKTIATTSLGVNWMKLHHKFWYD